MKTYQELLEDFDRLKREIDTAREYEAARLAERIAALLAESGVDMRRLLDALQVEPRVPEPVRPRMPVKPKYWDPVTGATWAGRGKTPRWLVGKDWAEYRIPDDASNRD
ncbi:H-NS histone family protein [Burkholderia sp. Ac-20345]|uniref:H-NS histone family protein n=1 Tax=Burkholderia sp. Ac-20345 TaxID=2703891 RepID=UPI00197B7476|nr:H-NS histone family protein [Burkholderia sp. Ac-20345]MBN3778135.1 H-NS histone family protein [Burkholderia sp. Ac-20345]